MPAMWLIKMFRQQRHTEDSPCIAIQTDILACCCNLQTCWVIFKAILGHPRPELQAEPTIPIYSHCGGHD